MKIIIAVIVIVFLLFLLLLLIKSNYKTETFITKKDLDDIKNYKGKVADTYDTIDNPIEDNLLPNNPNDIIKLNEYEIIEIYRNILERPPTIQEMKKHAYFSNSELREILYNSPEYDKLIKTQNNDVNNGIEGAIAKRNIINRIILMYSTIYKNDLPIKMMTPLRDCFIHLQLNEYLFSAMLESLNYKKFEVDVLSTYVLTKKILLQLFNKHFNVLELKLLAQEKINKIGIYKIDIKDEINIIKRDLLSTSINSNNNNISTTAKIIDTIKNSFPNVYNELIKSMDDDTKTTTNVTSPKTDIDILNEYLKSIERYENKNNESSQEPLQQSSQEPLQQSSQEPSQQSSQEPSQQPSQKPSQEPIIENLEIDSSLKRKIDKLPDNAELYVRVYNPMKHNNNYQLPAGYKAPICTSLGQKQLEQPIFTESKLLFQGTDIRTAYTDTQVGSIMPKFIYKEYKDVKIN
jgi:hypothetical protein